MNANCVWQIVFLNGQFQLYIPSSCILSIGLVWTDIPSLLSISTA